jgi:hypothetical protein
LIGVCVCRCQGAEEVRGRRSGRSEVGGRADTTQVIASQRRCRDRGTVGEQGLQLYEKLQRKMLT